VIFVGMDVGRVMDGLRIIESQPRGADRLLNMVNDYQPRNVSDKIVRIITSYTDFMNSRVWKRA